jgi:4-hydroxy-tetrahydrodipicolinate synthase
MSDSNGTLAQGIFGVVVTPFVTDGEAVDEDRLAALVDAVTADGVEHLIACGNTGEYSSLTASERRRVVEIAVAAASARAPVIAGVGGALAEARMEADHARRVGAWAVMLHHPPHPFVSPQGLLAYVRGVAEIGLPVFPYLREPVFDLDGMQRLVEIPGVAGVKFAYNDLPFFAAAVQRTAGSAAAWICGTAEGWFPFFWQAGAVGFTSGLVNVTARPSRRLLQKVRAGERAEAMRIWNLLRPFEELRASHRAAYNVAVIKEALRQLGRPVGPVRPPASDVDKDMSLAIGRLLTALVEFGCS